MIHELIECISDVDFFFLVQLFWLYVCEVWNDFFNNLELLIDKIKKKYLDSLGQNGEFWSTKHQICQYYLLQGSSYHLSSSKADYILKKKMWKWYFVAKIVLTFCEKKNVLVIEKKLLLTCHEIIYVIGSFWWIYWKLRYMWCLTISKWISLKE
jgi:hypothetical protein